MWCGVDVDARMQQGLPVDARLRRSSLMPLVTELIERQFAKLEAGRAGRCRNTGKSVLLHRYCGCLRCDIAVVERFCAVPTVEDSGQAGRVFICRGAIANALVIAHKHGLMGLVPVPGSWKRAWRTGQRRRSEVDCGRDAAIPV